MPTNTDKKLDELLELVRQAITIKEEDKTYREKHAAEHRFLRTLIEEREASVQFKRAVAQKVITGGIWALIVALGSAAIFSAKAWILGKVI